VIKEVIISYQNISRSFQYGCCLYPTAPFVTSSLLHQAFKILTDDSRDSVFPVVKYSYPIWRSLKIEDKKVEMWFPENTNMRSQDLPAAYHDAGQFYWFNIQSILEQESLFTKNAGALIVDELNMHDIDTLPDWQIAEMKFKYLHGINNEG
jgi:N-acylneuraminate cytidylyltransferase